MLENGSSQLTSGLCVNSSESVKGHNTSGLQNSLPSSNTCQHWTSRHTTDLVLAPKSLPVDWSNEIIPQACYEDSLSNAAWKTWQAARASSILLDEFPLMVWFLLSFFSSPRRLPFCCNAAVDCVILSWHGWSANSALRRLISIYHLWPLSLRDWFKDWDSQPLIKCQEEARVILR